MTWWVSYEYGRLLSGSSVWPLPCQEILAALRATVWTFRGWEWRAWIGDTQVPQRTLAAFRLLDPSGNHWKHYLWLWRRNFTQAYEEQESAWIGSGRLPDNLRVDYVGLEHFSEPLPPTLLLTTHFGSAILGGAFLGRLGWSIDSVGSAVVEHPALPEAVRHHYARKFHQIGRMHQGRVILVERQPKAPYQTLTAGRSLILFVDMPPPTPEAGAVTLRFMGHSCRLAQGALRIALRTQVPVAAYLVQRLRPGRYRVHLAPPRPVKREEDLQPIFDFFTAHMQSAPWAWWAADLLPLMVQRP